MVDTTRVGDLEVDQDLDFQVRDWRAQSLGRWLLVIILGAALVGAFGQGWLSDARIESADAKLALHYERITRHSAEALLRFELRGLTAADTVVDLWIDQGYVRGLRIRAVTPEPALVRVGSDRLTYRFRIESAGGTAAITLHTEPIALWRRRGEAGIAGGPSMHFGQLILP